MPKNKEIEKAAATFFGVIQSIKISGDETKITVTVDNERFISPDFRPHITGLQRFRIDADPVDIPSSFLKDSLL